jgi:hypothetical protein
VIEILISRRIFCAGRNADGLLATSAAHMHVLSCGEGCACIPGLAMIAKPGARVFGHYLKVDIVQKLCVRIMRSEGGPIWRQRGVAAPLEWGDPSLVRLT